MDTIWQFFFASFFKECYLFTLFYCHHIIQGWEKYGEIEDFMRLALLNFIR